MMHPLLSRVSVPKIETLHHLASGAPVMFFTQFAQDSNDIEESEESLCTTNYKLLFRKDSPVVTDTTFCNK